MFQLLPATTKWYTLKGPKLLLKLAYGKHYYFTMEKTSKRTTRFNWCQNSFQRKLRTHLKDFQNWRNVPRNTHILEIEIYLSKKFGDGS